MSLKDFLEGIRDDVSVINSDEFEVEVVETRYVPSFDDSYLTFDNLDSKIKKTKLIETCVLYIDIRNSVSISVSEKSRTLSKIYSSFVRSMVTAARYYGGHVRNIIGDRVMVIFDKENCFLNAINTAILMNNISTYILSKKVKGIEFKCGIGIDYGKMLVTKSGLVKRGSETEFYRSFVWLGMPANIASRLTDIANKEITTSYDGINEIHYYPALDKWSTYEFSTDYFLDRLEQTLSPTIKHKDESFKRFYKMPRNSTVSYPPILISEATFLGYKSQFPEAESIKNGWWKELHFNTNGFSGKAYGTSQYFPTVNEIM